MYRKRCISKTFYTKQHCSRHSILLFNAWTSLWSLPCSSPLLIWNTTSSSLSVTCGSPLTDTVSQKEDLRLSDSLAFYGWMWGINYVETEGWMIFPALSNILYVWPKTIQRPPTPRHLFLASLKSLVRVWFFLLYQRPASSTPHPF